MKLILGDCLEILPTLEADSIDALVTDPPAGISFMGKSWDHDHGGRDNWIAAFAAIFRECLRVLKPGAHGLVWALPRTSHWAATALEDAGFEVRDVVVHHFGSGFPKSLDVGKAIDKEAGTEREDLGPNPKYKGHTQNIVKGRYASNPGKSSPGKSLEERARITIPATPEAEKWNGWGTALKPASEFYILVRKPLGERTVAVNVLRHGTGAINVDAGRIGVEGEDTGRKSISKPYGGAALNDSASVPQDSTGHGKGRFPANLVLSHSAACRRVGEKDVKGSRKLGGISRRGQRAVLGDYGMNPTEMKSQCNPDGTETVAAWECVPGCPVKELDDQGGELTSGTLRGERATGQSAVYGNFGQNPVAENFPGSTGTASRFFYQAKAPNAEKSFYCLDCLRIFQVEYRADHKHGHETRDHIVQHPTPKAIQLMQYFVKLITPPNGIVLDPFMGTGSTGMACNGFGFVGIERDEAYFEIAKHRLANRHGPLFSDPVISKMERHGGLDSIIE